jgi:hypothetical protein
MMRAATMVVTMLLAITTLTACGGGDPYCDAVKDRTSTLNSFGQKRTTAAYTAYARTFRSIAKEAPASVKPDWTMIAKVTEDVLAAQKEVGLKLEQMTDTAKVKKLTTAQLQKLNNAYEAFNKTTDQRKAVVKNVKKECKITLT